MNRLRTEQLKGPGCWALTLTLPAGYEQTPAREFKRFLDRFGKRLHRAYPLAYGVWVAQGQRREAPHVHALLLGITCATRRIERGWRRWLRCAWAESVGSGDAQHVRYGARIERPWDPYGWITYMTRREAGPLKGWAGHRVWGEWGRQNRGKYAGTPVSEEVPFEEVIEAKREERDRKRQLAARIKDPARRARALRCIDMRSRDLRRNFSIYEDEAEHRK